MSEAAWTHPCYAEVANLVRLRTGLVFGPARRAFAEAGIRRAMAKAGVPDADEYLDRLRAGNLAIDDLIPELTVAETYLFRDRPHFAFVEREIVPEVLARRGPDHTLRVWSAGCATGEEAYSLAILFEEMGLGERVFILATDISLSSLAHARAGAYGARSFRDPGHPADRYFRKAGRRFVVSARLGRRVSFEYLNLAMDRYPSFATNTWGFDLILCRNVLIYFDAATTEAAGRRLAGCLAAGGWLITGPSDPPLTTDLLEPVVVPEGVFYRRPVRPRCRPGDIALAIDRPFEGGARRADSAAMPLLSLPPDAADPIFEARAVTARQPRAQTSERPRGGDADAEAHAREIRRLADRGDVAAARATAERAIAIHPLCAELHFLHGVLLMDLRRYREATQSMRRVVYLEPRSPVPHLVLGAILRRLGNTKDAARAFETAERLAVSYSREDVVPLADGETADRLAEAAVAQLALSRAGDGRNA